MRWLLVVLVLAACTKKKDEEAPPSGQSERAPPQPARPPPKPAPIPPAADGPAYVSVQEEGVMSFAGGGWKDLAHPGDKWVRATSVSLGADGTLWAYSRDRLWKLDGGDFAEQPLRMNIDGIAGGADGSVWVLADGKLHHLVAGKEAPVTLPTDDPPHGVARDLEGVWFATLDRTYRGSGETWTAYDVPGVTGAQVDILQIDSTGRDAYLMTTSGVFAFDGKGWTLVPGTKTELGTYASVVAGPAGRFALNTDAATYAGDAVRGLRKLGSRSDGIVTALDARGRLWLLNENEIRVVDDNLEQLKKFTPGDTPALARRAVWVVVGEGGPAHLDQSERAAGTVTGKVEGSAAGLRVRMCQQERPAYDKEPCDGVPGTRESKTAAGGTFSIASVAVGPQFFYVQRGGRWRPATPAKPCCADLAPEGTFDAGTLTLR